MERSIFGARRQIAFYASTPAYLPMLQRHGRDTLPVEAKRLSKEGKWVEMAGLIDCEILNTVAVVGSPARIRPGRELRLSLVLGFGYHWKE